MCDAKANLQTILYFLFTTHLVDNCNPSCSKYVFTEDLLESHSYLSIQTSAIASGPREPAWHPCDIYAFHYPFSIIICNYILNGFVFKI